MPDCTTGGPPDGASSSGDPGRMGRACGRLASCQTTRRPHTRARPTAVFRMIAPTAELFTLLYTSLLAPDAVIADVADIARTSRRRNRLDDITGLLVFDGSSFAQLVEGPQPAIVDLRDRLVADRRHCDMDVLVFGRLGSARQFPGWDLGYHFADRADDAVPALRGLRGAAALAKFEIIRAQVDVLAESATPSTDA